MCMCVKVFKRIYFEHRTLGVPGNNVSVLNLFINDNNINVNDYSRTKPLEVERSFPRATMDLSNL